MDKIHDSKAITFLQTIVNQPLCYGIKSPDTDLYDFGFGKAVEDISCRNENKVVCTYALHSTCCFRIICRTGEKRVDRYYGDTPCEDFHANIKRIIGLTVRRVALSDKNDLWLDFGDYWMVFVTYENGEESWRYFTIDSNCPHLVASNLRLDF